MFFKLRQNQVYSVILFLFFLSGVSALVYEIVWVKWFGYVFGVTIYAVTTVVAAFMGGLALGSFLFGRYVDRQRNPLRIYILLELGIALYAVSFPLIIKKVNLLYIVLSKYLGFSVFVHSVGMFVLGFILLLIPTVFMGGTLPVLTRFIVRKVERVGESVGDLYSLNTFGGAVGVLVSAFVLIPVLGLIFTAYVAILFNLFIVLAFVLLNYLVKKRVVYKSEVVVERQEKKLPTKLFSKSTLYLILLVFGLSGFASLAYEILWTRMLMPVFGIHVYSFATVLAIFLIGIAVGSLIFSRFLNDFFRVLDKENKLLFVFALVELFIGVGGVLSVILFNYFVSVGNTTLSRYLIVIVPTLFMGISFPLVVKILGRNIKFLGRTVGSVYSVNTVGAILGTFVAGFLLLRFFGIQTSVFLVAVINFVLCLVILLLCKDVKKVLKTVLIVVVVVFIFLTPVMNHYASENVFKYSGAKYGLLEEILYYKEGVTASVTVYREKYKENMYSLSMQVNGKTHASTIPGDTEHLSLLSHLPLLLHENPEETLFVGLATGISAGVATLYPVKTIDVAEISPEVVEASELFSDFNYNLSKDARYNLIIDDARNYLLKTDKKYDVISSDPTDPYVAGSGNLFSKDYFELIKSRLRRGGVVAQWVPLYMMSNDDFKTAIKTFQSVFPHINAWLYGGDIILIGSDHEIRINQKRFEKAFEDERIRADFEKINISNSSMLLSFFLFNETEVEEYVKGARINTDDAPLLEYNTPKSLRKKTIPENRRSIEEFKRRSKS